MVEFLDYPSVKNDLVKEVVFVARLTRSQPNFTFKTTSLPGHVIQLSIRGQTRYELMGVRYDVRPGSVLWFHNDEEQVGRVLKSPWTFYTMNFIAPGLSAPPVESRLQQVGPAVAKVFESLHACWRDMSMPRMVRDSRVLALMMDLLSRVCRPSQAHGAFDPATKLWWDLETEIRRDLCRPVDLDHLSQLSGRSPTTIARASLRAVGVPPMRRVKQIRMSLAWGLVMFSDLRMTEIAERVGYARVHEFSRDYRRHYGRSPMHDRLAERPPVRGGRRGITSTSRTRREPDLSESNRSQAASAVDSDGRMRG